MERLDPDKILIIDDEKSLRDGAERILGRMGCEVFKAETGEEGLEIIHNEPVSIVLLDMRMPGMDGMEVLQKTMEMDEGIIVIVITGFATIETAIEAMKTGAYDFISKPYEPDQLRIAVNRGREKVRLKRDTRKLKDEQKQTLEDLHTEQSRTHTIIESLPNGVIVTDPSEKVILINPAARQHLALDADRHPPGRNISEYIEDTELCRLIKEISKGRYIDFTTIPSREIQNVDGKHLLARCRPVIGEKGECLGAVVNLMDITTMKTLDLLKSEFVAKVSHELRSPLSTIHEQLATVLDGISQRADEDDQYMLARAKEKTFGLINTIGDLLDLSRIESGTRIETQKPVKVDQTLQEIVEFLNNRAEAKNQSLTLELPQEGLPEITADPTSLESVFGNLISNAINYTQEGGTIQVKADITGNNIRVKVIDNGFGIEAKYIDKIFERFYRVKNDKTRFLTGTGLGLP
ncbi:MAG: response regulator, partial [Desulfobacteraceae bacterium]